jgi:hypothetical protein
MENGSFTGKKPKGLKITRGYLIENGSFTENDT